jgi:predicted DNA-binding protein (UPF0251 family)
MKIEVERKVLNVTLHLDEFETVRLIDAMQAYVNTKGEQRLGTLFTDGLLALRKAIAK